jgi:hypothetical protein
MEANAKTELDWRGYEFNKHTKNHLAGYIVYKNNPGGFLMSVLANDLTEACLRADSINKSLLFEIVSWIYHRAPAECHGSYEKVNNWLDSKYKETK